MLRKPQAMLALAALCGIVAAASAAPAQTTQQPPVAQSAAFVTAAGQANAAEIAAAQLALQVSSSPQIDAFAKQMINDHTSLGQTLMPIATAQNISVPGAPSTAQAAQLAKLKGLTGSAFDAAYAASQVAAHRQAVALFSTEASTGSDVQFRQFAAASLPTMRRHLQMSIALANQYPGGRNSMTSTGSGSGSSGSMSAGQMTGSEGNNNQTTPGGSMQNPNGSRSGTTNTAGGGTNQTTNDPTATNPPSPTHS